MPKHSPDDAAFRRLVQLINEWNHDHYDIFALTQPNEDLEFHGVMRFFFQDAGAKVATKCIRVASTATAKEVVDVLVEKFHPDMRMLTMNDYNLYEVHVNGEERKLANDECPLFVQLHWGTDMREGRFLLKCAQEITAKDESIENERGIGGFKRKLSKREKKEKKKREKERLKNKENLNKDSTLAEKLYTDVPENSFTRSISNPEAVMRRRRQQKVEKRLQQFQNETGSESGGMLKIHGEALSPNVPYKTLLVSANDTAKFVVEETLDKYGVPKEESYKYCLVQVTVPKGDREYHGGSLGDEKILDDDECPLAIQLQHVTERGSLIFQLRLRPQDDRKKERMRAAVSHNDLCSNPDKSPPQQYRLPYLLELHSDGREIIEGRIHYLQSNVTEVGSEKSVSESGQYLQLFGQNILPHHCVIAHMDGSVTLTPTKPDAETYINDEHVSKTTLLQDGMIIRFGLNHIFRFCDSRSDENLGYPRGSASPSLRHQPGPYGDMNDEQNKPFETTFELNGHVETLDDQNLPRGLSREDLHKSAPNHSPHSQGKHGAPSGRPAEVLPAILEFREEAEDQLLRKVILNTKCNTVQFKLAPTYTLYLAIRHRLSNAYYPELPPQERALRLTNFINKISGIMQQAIEESYEDPAALAFLMANTSETYNFIKQDQDTRLFSRDAQEVMAESVQMAFHHLVGCLQYDLQQTMPAFIDPDDSVDDDDFGVAENMGRGTQRMSPTLGDVLRTLSAAMNLLRRCRVNAALTIQLFSQLFHFINMWLFNILIQRSNLKLCTRRWGIRLKRRLGRVEAWAEKQGLELAADCHLCRIIQAAHLLQAPKNNSDDIANISSTCFKLNSLQVRALLQHYIPEDNEPHIPQLLIDKVVAVATNMADELAQSEGSEIRLEEDKDLQLPFLLPEDGYSCDIIRGVPNGLPEYIDPFTRAGICRLIPQPNSKGLWTVHMVGPDQQGPKLNELHPKDVASPHPGQGSRPEELPKEPEIVEVSFEKVKGSIGLSIVAAKGDGQMSRGIYIKSVVPGGAAALDGRLQAGDQLLEVDGRSLVGLSQEKAANLMTKTGNVVCLKVSKQGAIYHGLATLLSQPSPTMQRANGPKKTALMQQEASMKTHPRSEENLFNGPARESERPQSRPKPDFRDNSLPRQQPLMNESRPPYSHPGPQSSPSPNSEGPGPNPRNNTRYAPNSQPSANFPHPDPYRTPPHLNNQHSPRGEDPRSRSTSNLRQEEMAMYQKPLSPQQNVHGTISANARNSSPSANIPGDDYRMVANKRSPPHRQPQPEPTPPQQSITLQPYTNGNARQVYDQHPPYISLDSSRYAGPMQRPLDQDPKMVESNRYIEQHPRGQENVRHMNYNKSEPGRYQHSGTEPQRNNYSHPDRGSNYTPSPIPSYQQKPMTNHPSAMNQSPASSLPKDDYPYSMATSSGSHDRPEFSNGQLRPHSDDISADKVREWQAKHDVDYSNNSYNSSGTLEQPKYPPYMESPEQKSVTSHYAKISAESREINNDIPKASVNNQARQQHFYEKTKQRIQEPAPPFHQLQRPGEQEAMKKPAVPPKTVSLKSVDKGPPINDIPRVNVHDNRPIQPQPQIPAQNIYNVRYAQQQKHVQSLPMMAPQTAEKFKGPDMTERREKLGLPELDHSDLPPPPEIPPDLPPPPAPEDLQEMLPPPQDFRVAYHSENQNWQQANRRYNSPNDFGPSTQNYKLGNLGQRGPEYTESYRPTLPPPDQNNYKGYPAQINNYEGHSYERRSTETQGSPGYQLVSNSRHEVDSDQDQRMLYPQPNVSPPQPPVNLSGASVWEREEKTKIIKQEEINMNRIRETEIRKLSEKKYRSPQEEDRLKKLCLEDEFQRRVQEVGDDEEDNESEPEITPYRQQSQEWLIKNIQEDLQKTLNRLREIDENRASEEYKKETERMQRLRQRLEIFEKERDDDRKRLQRRQQQKILEQEQHLQKQRELREKQRRDFEEQRKIHLMEEEKMRERKMEDLRRKKELEREQIQAAREAEEEIRRRNEEKKLQEQQMRPGNRYNDLPTTDYNSINNYNSAYLDYGPSMSFPPPPPADKLFQSAPQPPERGSSYETLNQYQIRGGIKLAQDQGLNDIPAYNNVGRSTSTSALRSNPDVTAPKKSVSFNTQLETRINPSFSSYPSSSSSHASDQYNPTNSSYHENDDMLASPTTPTSDVFDVSQPQTPTSPPPVTHPKPTEVHYRTAEVPGVIGSQEVYRDPRTRIQAKKAANSVKMPGPERMSFRDKMKYFAQEAGENTPKEKPKASRVQRNIESAMNGQ